MSTTPAHPRVLFVAPVEPWCRENGSSLIIADMLEGLRQAGGADMLPVFLRRPPAGCHAQVPSGYDGIQLGLEGVPRWVSIVKALALRSSPIRMRFANRKVARLLIRTVKERGFAPTIVHVEHLPLVDMGLAVARAFDCPLVYRSHNVEAQLLERRMTVRGPLARMVLRHMARAEADALDRCDLTLCISDVDLAWARAHAPSANVKLFPCSLLVDRYDAFGAGGKSREPQIGFAGGLDWAPNENGLQWFVEKALPRITAAVPGARLAVLARGATTRPWLTTNPAIRILDDRSDARELFASSWVSIAPLLQGGGVRIKIPESLALGCPVVATTIGAEGHDLPGLTRADEPEAFAAACAGHLRAVPAESRAQLRAAVDARHGATVLARQLLGYWTELLRSRRGAAA
ncbi:MAG: glycosyltransferase [Gemmatimonadaceae bacterium]